MTVGPLSRGLLVGALAWTATALVAAIPLGRALCAGLGDSGGGLAAYVACQHGVGRLWQALFLASVAFLLVGLVAIMWSTRHDDAVASPPSPGAWWPSASASA